MFLFTYITTLFGVLCLGLAGIILYTQRIRGMVDQLALMILSVAVWVLSNALADVSIDTRSVLLLSGLAMIGFQWFASFFLHFVISFTQQPGAKSYVKLLAGYLPTTVISCFAFSSYAIKTIIIPYTSPSQIIVGPLYSIGPWFLLVVFGIGYYELIRCYQSAPHRKQLQILYIMIGTACTLGGVLIFDIILPIWGEYRFFSAGPLSTGLLIACLVYAVFRHHLLDIRLAVQRSILYGTLLALIIGAYLIILLILNRILGAFISSTALMSAGLTTIIGIFAFPSLKQYFIQKTDYFLFKNSYDYSDAMQRLSQITNQHIDLQELTEMIPLTLKDILKASDIILALSDRYTDQGYVMVIPIISEGKQVATLLLGPKLSGDTYHQRDMQLLATFAYQVGIAIQRAHLHEIVKKHSRELEQKVTERTARIQKLQEEQQHMMMDISHGLQTPLTIVTAELEELKKRIPHDPRLDILQRSTDHISQLTYDLLRLARLESQDLIVTHVDLSVMLAEQIEYFDTLARGHSIHISSSIAPGVMVMGQKDKLEELVVNLVSNAIKYMSPERTEKRITIDLSATAVTAQLTIKDNGIGIQRHYLPFIFDRLYRIKSTQGLTPQGSGLGLSICKAIVEKHHGTISVTSTYGHGSSFSIALPILHTTSDS